VTELREVPPDEWDELLEALELTDVYFRRAHLESAALLGQGRPVYLHLREPGGDVVFPALVREASEGYRDIGTPMGYGGPLASGDDPPVAAFFDAYDGWCRESLVVATFARFHPVLGNQRLAEGHWQVEHIGHSVGWRVGGRDASEVFAGMDAHHRRVVRKARAAGVELVPGVGREIGSHELDGFVDLYRATMLRRDASSFYYFPDEYWLHLATKLGDALVRFDAYEDEELVACILCLAAPPVLHYHLGASSDRGQSLGANHVLFCETATWAAERGFELFHLGGGVGGFEDSLYEFKRRFDPEGLLPAKLGKAVHDAEAYRRLSGKDEIDYAGYFPAYRRSG
jgi:serine/alanine adding enzyme